VMNLTMPLGEGGAMAVSRLEVTACRNGSLEGIGRRMMFFGRLMDECGVSTAVGLGRFAVGAHSPDPDSLRRRVPVGVGQEGGGGGLHPLPGSGK